MATLRELGEFPFIEAIAAMVDRAPGDPSLRLGIGDDAAVIATGASTLVSTDTQTEGVHFRRDWLSPRALGARAFRVAVSDISAMGGRPRHALLSLGLPRDHKASEALGLVRGFVDDAAAAGVVLVGGNVSEAPVVSITVTVLGDGGRGALKRAGARSGDLVFVSGALGNASAGVAMLERGLRRGKLVDAYRRPPLRISAGRALSAARLVTAMIDVSDGLLQDLGHLCRESRVSVRLDPEAVPISPALRRSVADPYAYALAGGDDYELVFTAPRAKRARALSALESAGCSDAACIGTVVGSRGGHRVLDAAGKLLRSDTGGYSHFRRRQ